MFKFENERQEGVKCVNVYCSFCKDEPDIICDAVNAGGDPSYSDCLCYLPEKLLVAEEPAQQTTNKQMVSAAQIATQVKLLYEDAPPREYSREEVIVILKQLHHL